MGEIAMSEIDIKKYKIICGAMSWISDPKLVSAISNTKQADTLGVLASGAFNGEQLNQALHQVRAQTNKPYGVNLIGMSPYFDELLAVCADHKVPIIIYAAAMPRRERIQAMKATGAKVLAFATSLRLAQDMIKNGVDGLILEGNEAGGHVGMIATSVLVQEILFNIKDFPVFIAGGIGHGKMMKEYMRMGAAGCQLGTRFVCAKESPMHPETKQLYIRKHARDTIVVGAIDPIFNVIPVRVIKNKACEDFYAQQRKAIELLEKRSVSAQEAQLMIEHFWSGSLRRGVLEGDLENGSLMAGQSISFVNAEESVQEIVDKLYQEMASA